MRPNAIVAILAASLLSSAAHAGVPAGPQFRPGYWQRSSQFLIKTIDGEPAPPSMGGDALDTDGYCLNAEDVADTAGFFGRNVSEMGCADLVVTATAGKITLAGSCSFNETPVSLKANGSYSSDHAVLTLDMTGTVQGHSFSATGTMRAEYARACTPAEISAD